MKSNELTQKKLAALLNINQSSISDLLNGVTLPKFGTLISISEHFNTSLDYLAGITENPEINK